MLCFPSSTGKVWWPDAKVKWGTSACCTEKGSLTEVVCSKTTSSKFLFNSHNNLFCIFATLRHCSATTRPAYECLSLRTERNVSGSGGREMCGALAQALMKTSGSFPGVPRFGTEYSNPTLGVLWCWKSRIEIASCSGRAQRVWQRCTSANADLPPPFIREAY